MTHCTIAGIENITSEFLSLIQIPDEQDRKLRYLFVMPVLALDNDSPYGFPVGFTSVCAALKASGRSVFTLNLNYKGDPVLWLRHAITVNAVDVLLTGGLSVQYQAVKWIVDTAKAIKPGVITVVGGGLITADPVTAMTALENADYGVIGEGEILVNALAYSLEHDRDPAELDGIICERDGTWSVRDKWAVIHDLDILPFPDYPGFEYGQMLAKSGQSSHTVMTAIGNNRIAVICPTRSCPYLCTFCFHTCGNTYREMSLDRVFQLLDWLRSFYPIEGLVMQNELFFANEDYVLEFCRRIEPYRLRWTANARAAIPEKLLLRVKESGCVRLLVGIESADNRILKSMRKGITIEQVEKTIALAHKLGLQTAGFLIVGDPEETRESLGRSIEWFRKHRHLLMDTSMAHLLPYPGSHVYKTACANGRIPDPVQYLKDGLPPVNLSKLTDDEFSVLPSIFNMIAQQNRLVNAVIEPLDNCAVYASGACPHCLRHISFPPFASVFNLTPRQCPACGKFLSVNPFEHCDHDALNNAATALIDGKNAAVWAITNHNFYWLMQAVPVLKEDNVTFINNYEIVIPENGKVVKTLWGKTIHKPNVIDSENIETVIVPNAPHVFQAIKAQCAREFPSVKNITHITELLWEKG